MTFHTPSNELKATYARVKMGQKQFKNKLQKFKDDIEKTLNEVQNITEDMTHKLKFTFSECIEPKRKLLDCDHTIDFVDTEKDFDSIYDQFEVSKSDDIDGFMTLSDLMQNVATKHSGCGRRVPQFLHKLYDMVENEEINDLVSWNLSYRDSFIISDINKFSTLVLPMYFKHTNFSSFHSQLNIYASVKGKYQ